MKQQPNIFGIVWSIMHGKKLVKQVLYMSKSGSLCRLEIKLKSITTLDQYFQPIDFTIIAIQDIVYIEGKVILLLALLLYHMTF